MEFKVRITAVQEFNISVDASECGPERVTEGVEQLALKICTLPGEYIESVSVLEAP